MPAFEVTRTLVKSPPEVWAELEQSERLAALLGDDAIKITKTDPEKAIEWEGSNARGRIEIEVSSWGTKVRLTTEAEEAPEPAAAVAPEPEPVAEVEPQPEPELVAEAEPEAEPEPLAESVAAAVAESKTFWQRVKGWFNSEHPAEHDVFEAPDDDPVAEAELDANSEPELEPEPAPEPVAKAEPEPEPTAEAEPEPQAIDYEQNMVALLDHLGSAHKRPFVNA